MYLRKKSSKLAKMVTWKSQYDCEMKCCTFYLIFARIVMYVVGTYVVYVKEGKKFTLAVLGQYEKKKVFSHLLV